MRLVVDGDRDTVTMSDDGEQLWDACRSSDPQEAVQLLTGWDHQRIQDAAQYKDEGVRELFGMIGHYTWNMSLSVVYIVCIIPQKGTAPLHQACMKGNVKVVEMLLTHSVDAKAKTNVSTAPSLIPL